MWAYNDNTGVPEKPIAIEGQILEAKVAGDSAVVNSLAPAGQTAITLVDFITGQSRTLALDHPLRKVIEPVSSHPPAEAEAAEGVEPPAEPTVYRERGDVVPTGNDAVLMTVHLLEKKLVTVQTIKAQQNGAFEKGDLNVKDTADATQEILNDIARQRMGGVRLDDASRYSVTLRLLFAPGVPEWNEEVTGAPNFFSLPSVDLLVADRRVIVFDKKNVKLWESQLGYPIDPTFASTNRFSFRASDLAAAPAIERGDTIYFFDRGILTAFDRLSGAVRWRLPSVGISHLQLDDHGMLYVATTSRGPESIQYSDQVTLRDRPVGVILKVDPSNGKILWKAEGVADQFHLAEPYLYGSHAQFGRLGVIVAPSSGRNVPLSFSLFRINPANGEAVWTYYQAQPPVAVDFQRRTILWLVPGELRILRYLSL